MAVEDHARYLEWSDALDRFKEANDCLRAAVLSKMTGTPLDMLKMNFQMAKAAYLKISDEIDA